jgi:hypothetical protein
MKGCMMMMRKNSNHSLTPSRTAVTTFSCTLSFTVWTPRSTEDPAIILTVYFIWRYLERFSFKNYALVIHPSDDLFPTTPRLLTLRYYRTANEGWNDSDDCDRCVQLYQDALLPFSTRQQPAACACPICIRQPPSLRDLCLHVINSSRSGISFKLTVRTSFAEYKHA